MITGQLKKCRCFEKIGAIWMDDWAVWYKGVRESIKDHPSHTWFILVKWYQWKSKRKCRWRKQHRKPPSFESLYVLYLSYIVNSTVDIEYYNTTSVSGIMATTRYQKTEYLTLDMLTPIYLLTIGLSTCKCNNKSRGWSVLMFLQHYNLWYLHWNYVQQISVIFIFVTK